MSGGGGQGDDDGLGAFLSESEEIREPRSARSVARHALESPRLVPIVLALAVIGYGSLMVLWWERDQPRLTPPLSGSPTQPFRPGPPQPREPSPTTAEPFRDLFVPAVARADDAPRPSETAVPLPPAPLADPLPDPAEDVLAPRPAAVPVPEPVVPPPPSVAAAAPVDAAPTAPAREPEPPAVVDRLAADRDAIGGVLRSYRAAYNTLDATSASTIWQGLDTRTLERAFSTLSRQDVVFDRCDVRVTGDDRAVAVCRGVLSYVPKIGDGSPQQRRLSWTFDFQRAADRWMISAVTAR